MDQKTKDKCRSPMINRRRFLHGVAWMNGAIATGVSSWSIQSDWANAAAAPIKVGIATDLTGAIAYVGRPAPTSPRWW